MSGGFRAVGGWTARSHRRSVMSAWPIALAAVLSGLLVLGSGAPVQAEEIDGWEESYTRDDPDDPDHSQVEGYWHYDIREAVDAETGEPCWELYGWLEDEEPPQRHQYDEMQERLGIWDQSGVAFEACSVQVDPETTALELWVSLAVAGVDDVEVPPGYALTGMPAYALLSMDGDLTRETSTSEGGVTITIEAHPRFVIDWGDGSEPTETTDLGVAYPGGDGEIVHTYRDADDVTITVTTIWEATFTAPGIEQSLPAREYDTAHDLQVDEFRAVRVRPGA